MAIDEMVALDNNSKTRGWEQKVFYLCLGYFAVKAVYFVLNIHAQVFPDEAFELFGQMRSAEEAIL